MSETIAAISTALGEGGIGIVRVSGSASLDIMRQVMHNCPNEIEPRHAYMSKVVDSDSKIIDEAVFIFMKSPASYTGEDMLEIQAHGSNVSLKEILRTVLNCKGKNIRLAEPGEFTKLAFLNGKMDLSQAEAVIDIIKAKSDLSLEIAERQHEGILGNSIRDIRKVLLDVLAKMTVNIDYPDEDIEDVISDELKDELRNVKYDVEELIDSSKIGKIAREGIKVAIVGKPNVGKSSLMNAMLGEGRVIVTDIPGTTRDTVEENLNLAGIPIVLTDTAGLRETDDTVEKIGIERTEKAIASSDLVLLVLDASKELDDEDINIIKYIEKHGSEKTLVVLNKTDLGKSIDQEIIKQHVLGCQVVETSLVGKDAINSAKKIADVISNMFEIGSIKTSESNIITSERHLKLLKDSSNNLDEAIQLIENGEPLEVIELSTKYAYDNLGKIIGEEIGDEVLDTVFSKFCLGK